MAVARDVRPLAVVAAEGEGEVQLHLQVPAAAGISRHQDGRVAEVEFLDHVSGDGE